MPVDVVGQGTHGWIIVYPNGAMYAAGPRTAPARGSPGWLGSPNSFPLSESEAFTSLAGISYPVGS
jgi:hypothetical protein